MSEGSPARRSGWSIEVEVVPPGTLPSNPFHPLALLSPEQRRTELLEALEPFLPNLQEGYPSGSMGAVLEPLQGSEDAQAQQGRATG